MIDTESFENDIPLDLARRAHSGTSFSPEQRGASERSGYASTLRGDWDALLLIATTPEKLVDLEAEFARFRESYRTRYVDYLSARSRCMSTMITGGSNFPVRRQQKRNDVADKRLAELIEFRKRALVAIRKALQPELAPIMAGDADATERLAEKIAKAEEFQARGKLVNATIRKHAKAGPEAQVAALVAIGIRESTARAALLPDAMGNVGIPAFELSNNSANLRRMKERLASISTAQATAPTEAAGELARLEDNAADNRIRIFFPGKPDATVRSRLKSAGFRWTPSLGCWQAYRSDRARRAAEAEAGASLPAATQPAV